MDKKIFSLICAVACSFLWGTAFVAQDMGMDYIGPWTFSAARLILGFLALLPFFFIFEFKKVNGQFIVSKMLPISLSYDHRVIDGAEGARFCVHLSKSLGKDFEFKLAV